MNRFERPLVDNSGSAIGVVFLAKLSLGLKVVLMWICKALWDTYMCYWTAQIHNYNDGILKINSFSSVWVLLLHPPSFVCRDWSRISLLCWKHWKCNRGIWCGASLGWQVCVAIVTEFYIIIIIISLSLKVRRHYFAPFLSIETNCVNNHHGWTQLHSWKKRFKVVSVSSPLIVYFLPVRGGRAAIHSTYWRSDIIQWQRLDIGSGKETL